MNIKNIAISGEIGTGTTTLAKSLSEKLGWDYQSLGAYLRQWHKDNNVDIAYTELIPEELDKKLDYGFLDKVKEGEKTVFDWRVAGILASEQEGLFKILLTCDDEVAIDRVAKRDHETREEAIKESRHRSQELKEKFKKLYGAEDYLDPKYFDLVIDTTHQRADEVLQHVIQSLPQS